MILLDRLFTMDFSKNFTEMFQVVIQLGAIPLRSWWCSSAASIRSRRPKAPRREKEKNVGALEQGRRRHDPAMVAGVLLKKLLRLDPTIRSLSPARLSFTAWRSS